MQKKKIIITGGCGYIGSHTAVALQQNGFDVLILDNLCNSHADVVHQIQEITNVQPAFKQIDCTNQEQLEQVFSENTDAIGVIHFAALKAVGESVQQPMQYYQNNLFSLINVLCMMKKFNIPNFVFSSSACVYGEPETLPVTESTPLQPATSPYGATKVIGETIIKDTIKAQSNMRAVILRYFNPIGAHQSGKIGELPLGIPNNLMPYITQTVAGIRKKLSVFGNDYPTRDGFCIRDYIDVNDVADAHVCALNYMLNHDANLEIFNLGTGRGLSVMELITAFENATGQKINYEITERRPGDVPELWANADLAKEKLGWTSKRTLKETLQSAWKWQLNATSKYQIKK